MYIATSVDPDQTGADAQGWYGSTLVDKNQYIFRTPLFVEAGAPMHIYKYWYCLVH